MMKKAASNALKSATVRVNMVSDTITKPTEAMRAFLSNAEVGDDVFGTDPSVNYLQEYAAELLGKPSALFVPSGTMGNLISVGVHCSRGDEIILGNKSHIFMYEGGGASVYMGVGFHTLPNQADGTLLLKDIQGAVRADDPHYPRTTLVALENTQNTCGGRVLKPSYVSEVSSLCKKHNLKLHFDGARLGNASVALQKPLAELLEDVDTVSLCLSKGLGAPVGSIIAGSEEFIYKARRLRKSLGGGMRQAGLIASAGTFALKNNLSRLAEDHENAKSLAAGLAKIPGVQVDEKAVETNILFFSLAKDLGLSPTKLVDTLKQEKGVILGGGYHFGEKIRAVTHLHVSSSDIPYVVDSIRAVVDAHMKQS